MALLAEMIFLASSAIVVELCVNAVRTKLTGERTGWDLKGSVSIWMFPIYMIGLTYGFDAIYLVMKHISEYDAIRWISYPFWIWLVEYVIGTLTKNKLWDYSPLPYNIKGSVSLLHYPAWIIFGVMFEQLRYLYWCYAWI